MKNTCLVCGFNDLYEPPYDIEGIPSDEICPCCGFQYGFDDDVDEKEMAFLEWKRGWENKGFT
jgi:hypothetical protein